MLLRLLAAFALLIAPLAALADAPPLAAFFDTPSFTGAKLSPSGKFLAVRIGVGQGRERLAVVDLATNKIATVAYFSDADVNNFVWINDERLAFDTRDRKAAQGDLRSWPGLWAANRDGSRFKQLAEVNGSFVRSGSGRKLLPFNTILLTQYSAQDSDDVYALRPLYSPDDLQHIDLVRINTLTGRETMVTAPGNVTRWFLDAKGEPRLAQGLDKNRVRIWYRDPAKEDAWRELPGFDAFTDEKFDPVGFAPDGKLYVAARRGEDLAALYQLDLAQATLAAQPLLKVGQFDFKGSLVNQGGRLAGARYLGDAPGTAWFDPRLKALQETIDALLPATANTISVPARPETPWVLVVAESDVQPALYMLFNTETRQFNRVGAMHPAIDPKAMGRRGLVRLKARDGMEIPAWLTLPAGRAPKGLPLVVLVHGGPWARGGYWHWEPQSQFLASRGYAVLEPEFRGSTGYGERLFRAGWKQWGLKMQDDVADATRWAIAQGYADPARICIAGASYGGYATLMGLANDPDLYKCGVEWAGVTDIPLMISGSWTMSDDLSDAWRAYGVPYLIGDLKQDAARFAATSPLQQAARITQPLLLAHGGADRRVPLYHGTRFLDAVRKTNQKVEWIEYPEEGHGWVLAKNRIDFWGRVEKFLDQNIGH